MYIKGITIENVRSIKKLTLDFSSGDDFRRCVLILGNNGVGKTTILRCIALGLCDDTSASALLSELHVGDMSRAESENDPRIELTLGVPNKPDSTIITTFKKSTSGLDVTVKPSGGFPWGDIFCCGYGVARRPFGSESYPKYRLVDSVYTLFNYDTSLWSPEVVLARLQRTSIDFNNLLRRLEDILDLPVGSLSLGDSGIAFKGPWPGELGLYALGDGYSATLGWLTDMLGWALLKHGSQLDMDSLQGIVLVDMIERDLHPNWQRRILKSLRRHFPGLQFILTTHAPMCAIGTSDLTDEECELVALHMKGDSVEAIEDLRPPREDRVDEVLTSLLFSVSDVSGSELRNKLERFADLVSKQDPSEVEKAELAGLRAEFEDRFRLQSFDSQLLEFLSVATAHQLQAKVSGMSAEQLETNMQFVESLRDQLLGAKNEKD